MNLSSFLYCFPSYYQLSMLCSFCLEHPFPRTPRQTPTRVLNLSSESSGKSALHFLSVLLPSSYVVLWHRLCKTSAMYLHTAHQMAVTPMAVYPLLGICEADWVCGTGRNRFTYAFTLMCICNNVTDASGP